MSYGPVSTIPPTGQLRRYYEDAKKSKLEWPSAGFWQIWHQTHFPLPRYGCTAESSSGTSTSGGKKEGRRVDMVVKEYVDDADENLPLLWDEVKSPDGNAEEAARQGFDAAVITMKKYGWERMYVKTSIGVKFRVWIVELEPEGDVEMKAYMGLGGIKFASKKDYLDIDDTRNSAHLLNFRDYIMNYPPWAPRDSSNTGTSAKGKENATYDVYSTPAAVPEESEPYGENSPAYNVVPSYNVEQREYKVGQEHDVEAFVQGMDLAGGSQNQPSNILSDPVPKEPSICPQPYVYGVERGYGEVEASVQDLNLTEENQQGRQPSAILPQAPETSVPQDGGDHKKILNGKTVHLVSVSVFTEKKRPVEYKYTDRKDKLQSTKKKDWKRTKYEGQHVWVHEGKKTAYIAANGRQLFA